MRIFLKQIYIDKKKSGFWSLFYILFLPAKTSAYSVVKPHLSAQFETKTYYFETLH